MILSASDSHHQVGRQAAANWNTDWGDGGTPHQKQSLPSHLFRFHAKHPENNARNYSIRLLLHIYILSFYECVRLQLLTAVLSVFFQQEFLANDDRNTHVLNRLDPPLLTRDVRLHITKWYGRISMRFEIYGCRVG